VKFKLYSPGVPVYSFSVSDERAAFSAHVPSVCAISA